jgi:hypothetical protein
MFTGVNAHFKQLVLLMWYETCYIIAMTTLLTINNNTQQGDAMKEYTIAQQTVKGTNYKMYWISYATETEAENAVMRLQPYFTNKLVIAVI